MSIVLTINGNNYTFPEQNDENWGTNVTDWASAVTTGMLQRQGGSFGLLSEVDFGNAYGIKSLYYKSRSSDIADTGEIRLATDDEIVWRNFANDGNLVLTVDASDRLTFNGSVVGGTSYIASVSDTTTIDLTVTGSALTADIQPTSITNGLISGTANIALTKLQDVTANRVLESNGSGKISSSSVTSTTLGYLDATSSIQTQLDTKIQTASNIGAGDGLFSAKSGTDLEFKSLNAGSNVIIDTNTDDEITISASDGEWNIHTATSKKSYDPSAEITDPSYIRFSKDGTKQYILNSTLGSPADATVYQYTLSTPGDVSTASYASKSFDFSAQETAPTAFDFSQDGTKMYVVGTNGTTVYQYTLSTAWDVSTASFASKSLGISGQDFAPLGLAFSIDGTKMYMTGNDNDSVYQYTLSTAWDVSTGSYASILKDVSAQTTNPRCISFDTTGTYMYIIDTASVVYQYTLSTAWTVSSASFLTERDFSEQEATATGIAFSSNGIMLYIIGTTDDTVYQYKLYGLPQIRGGFKELANGTVTTTVPAIGTASNINVTTIAQAPDSNGITAVAGGGLKNTSGIAGKFRFQASVVGGWWYSSVYFETGARTLQSDGVTYNPAVFSSQGAVFAGSAPGQPTWVTYIDVGVNETVFPCFALISGSTGTLNQRGLTASMELMVTI